MLTDATTTATTIPADALEAFHAEREKLLSAVYDRFTADAEFHEIAQRDATLRLARESASIFFENFYVSHKYHVPQALDEYLQWLRGFLASRHLPASFIPAMMRSLRRAVQAFVPMTASDSIASALHALRRRELSGQRRETVQ
jgi:hypothetical protein